MSLHDIILPEGYSVIWDADSLELLDPETNTLAVFGPAWNPVAVSDVAFIDAENRQDRIERGSQ